MSVVDDVLSAALPLPPDDRAAIAERLLASLEDQAATIPERTEVQADVASGARKWGEGILRTAGAWADDSHWDAIMEEIHRSRKVERRPQSEDE